MDRRIHDIFEHQEIEDKLELQTNYINLIHREFKDSEAILSKKPSEVRFHMDRSLALSRVPVRIATKFSVRKHTTILTPYYHSHDFYELIYVYEGTGRQYINDDDKEVVLREGEACLLAPGMTHAVLPAGQGDIILKMVIPVEMFQELLGDGIGAKEEVPVFFLMPMGQGSSIRWLLAKLLEELYPGDGCADRYRPFFRKFGFSEKKGSIFEIDIFSLQRYGFF